MLYKLIVYISLLAGFLCR